METEPKHPARRLAALLLSLFFMFNCLPAALAVSLNVDAGFYFKQKQSQGGTCTLASAAMMLRRRAYMDGLEDWFDVTENSVRSSAWSGGLAHNFTYNAMQVGYSVLPRDTAQKTHGLEDWFDVTENSVRSSAWSGGLAHNFTYNAMQVGYSVLPRDTAQKTQTLIDLLAQHPEGIVAYDRTRPHAVLLTDYTDGVFYCADPAGSVSQGRIPLSQADRTRPHAVLLTDYTDGVFYCADPAGSVSQGRIPLSQARVSLGGISCYWFVSADQNGLTSTGNGLRLVGMRYPENVRQGNGVSLTGTVGAAPGTVLTEVEAAVLDAAGQTVQSAAVAPGTNSWSFKAIDSQIRFGELPAGNGVSLTGTVGAAPGTVLTEVEAAVLDAAGQTVQSAAAAPGTNSWSFKAIDSQIRFGELPAGNYSYMVLVTQSDGQSLCFMSGFTVSDAATSTVSYWSAHDAVTQSDGQSLCFMSGFTVSDAATSTVSYWSAHDAEGEKLVRVEEETEAQPAGQTETPVLKGLFDWLNTSF